MQLQRRTFFTGAGSAVAAWAIGLGRPGSWAALFQEQAMEITRLGTQPSRKGPEDWFTGSVRIDPLFPPHEPSRVTASNVTFEPGARTAWHTHPLGQTILITAGVGRVQEEGGPVVEVRAGDVVWFPPGVKHWHGASSTVGMTHIAIQEQLDGKVVDWLEQVSDEQYMKLG